MRALPMVGVQYEGHFRGGSAQLLAGQLIAQACKGRAWNLQYCP